MPHTDRVHDAGSAHRRDRGLRRVKVTTVAIAVAAATGSVVLGTNYAAALPGSSSASTPAPGTTAAQPSRAPSTDGAPSGGSTAGVPKAAASGTPTPLQPPVQAPVAAPTTQAPQPVQTTSGGS